MNKKEGGLYVVSTPIGNLQDITLRAIEVLKTVDYIAAEDTRHSAALLKQFGIATPLISLHDFNEKDRVEQVIDQLRHGQSIALISDAGTPLISDPGFLLVREVRATGIPIIPIPGACAAIAALSVAGLPTDKFVFEGFLPSKTKARMDRLEELANETRTMIFYEAPHRILDLIEDMEKVWGDERKVVIARELTKLFETIHAAPLRELIKWLKADINQQRGEIVVLVQGIEQQPNLVPSKALLTLLLEELPVKKTVEIVAKVTGEKRNELYEMAILIKNKKSPL